MSIAVTNTPFLDYTGVLMFVEKISMYFLVGATLYFSRNTKQDDRHNADPSVHDTMSNESLVTSDAQLTTELARFVTEFTLRNENFTAEVQRILTMLNTSTARIDEIEQVLQRIESIEEAVPGDDANQSEASSGSSQRSFSDISSEIWNQFKIIFDRIMAERAYSLDDMCGIVAVDILNLGVGKLSRDMIKKYYQRINDLKSSNLDKIGAWIDSKTVISE